MPDRPAAPGDAAGLWIHEFAHPAVVAHLHFPGEVATSTGQIEQALRQGVHAMELDLLHRPDGAGGGDVRCGHDAVTAASPALADVVALLLAHRGDRDTVQGDGLQFFLVLEPKADDPALFEGIYQVLAAIRPALSTSARPGTGPRGITVVLTGRHIQRCRDLLRERHGADVDRLLLGEDVDYRGTVEDLSGDPTGTFQWACVRYRDGLSGRVNALHLGAGGAGGARFNVRVWDTGSDLRLRRALAAGFDSVNCDPEAVQRFQRLASSQRPRGRSVRLAVRGSVALLVWRGRRSRNLYLSLGVLGPDGPVFRRQLCLTDLLPARPRARACAAALLPDGRLLLVGDNGRGPWYLTGRPGAGDRFPAVDDVRTGALAPAGRWKAPRRGSAPAVAVAPDGRVLVVFRAPGGRLRLYCGRVGADGRLEGRGSDLGAGVRGANPAVAFGAGGEVVVGYERTGGLRFVVGSLDPDGRVAGTQRRLDVRGRSPSVEFTADGRALLCYQTGRGGLRSVCGPLVDGLPSGPSRPVPTPVRATSPSLAIGPDGSVVLLHRAGRDGALGYLRGRCDADGQLTGGWNPVEMSLDGADDGGR